MRRQFSWTLPANVIYGACGLLLLVVLNKLGSTAIAGDYVLAMSIVAPVFMFANLRFSTILATDMRETVHLADYFKLRAILLLSAMVLVAIWCSLQNGFGIGWLLAVITLAKTIESIGQLCCGVQQRIERMDRVAISLASNGLAIIVAFAATYYVTRNLTLAATAILVARCVVLLAYDLPNVRRAAREEVFTASPTSQLQGFDRDKAQTRMRALLLSALPLGATAALVSLTLNVPRYVISAVHDRQMLGMFASIAVMLQAGALVFRAIEQPAMPRLAKLIETRDAYSFWRLVLRLCCLFVGFAGMNVVLSLLVGPQVLTLLFNANFADLGGVLALMALATAISQMAGLIESSLIAARLTAVQVPMHCITVVSCVVLCRWLVPTTDLYGAVLAVAVCRFPFMLIGVWLLRQKLSEANVNNVTEFTPNHRAQNVTAKPRRMAA